MQAGAQGPLALRFLVPDLLLGGLTLEGAGKSRRDYITRAWSWVNLPTSGVAFKRTHSSVYNASRVHVLAQVSLREERLRPLRRLPDEVPRNEESVVIRPPASEGTEKPKTPLWDCLDKLLADLEGPVLHLRRSRGVQDPFEETAGSSMDAAKEGTDADDDAHNIWGSLRVCCLPRPPCLLRISRFYTRNDLAL